MRHLMTTALVLLIVACGLDTTPQPAESTSGRPVLEEVEIAKIRLALFGTTEELDPVPPQDLRAAKARDILRDLVDKFGSAEAPPTTPEAILRDRIDQFGRKPRS